MQQHSQYCFPELQMHILAKKKIDKSLGIDENRNKEVESDDIMLDQAEDKQEK